MVQMLAVASNLGLKTLEQNCAKQINEKRSNYPVAAEILDASDRQSRSISTILNRKPHHRLKDLTTASSCSHCWPNSSDRNNNSSSISQNLTRRLCLPDTVDQGVQVGTLEFLSKDSSTITYMIPLSDIQKVFINWSIPVTAAATTSVSWCRTVAMAAWCLSSGHNPHIHISTQYNYHIYTQSIHICIYV